MAVDTYKIQQATKWMVSLVREGPGSVIKWGRSTGRSAAGWRQSVIYLLPLLFGYDHGRKLGHQLCLALAQILQLRLQLCPRQVVFIWWGVEEVEGGLRWADM